LFCCFSVDLRQNCCYPSVCDCGDVLKMKMLTEISEATKNHSIVSDCAAPDALSGVECPVVTLRVLAMDDNEIYQGGLPPCSLGLDCCCQSTKGKSGQINFPLHRTDSVLQKHGEADAKASQGDCARFSPPYCSARS
jgi:hypothetical protein